MANTQNTNAARAAEAAADRRMEFTGRVHA